jgi:hypothetical protein
VSSVLVIKSVLSIYLIAKATSSILHSLGLVLFAIACIDWCYCFMANWTASWHTKGIKNLQEAANKKQALISYLLNYKTQHGISEIKDITDKHKEAIKQITDKVDKLKENHSIAEAVWDDILNITNSAYDAELETNFYLKVFIQDYRLDLTKCKLYVNNCYSIKIDEWLTEILNSCNITLTSIKEAFDNRRGGGCSNINFNTFGIEGADSLVLQYYRGTIVMSNDEDKFLFYDSIECKDLPPGLNASINIRLKPKITSDNKEKIVKDLRRCVANLPNN